MSQRVNVNFRVRDDIKREWEAAAESFGLTLSAWMTDRLTRAAREERRRRQGDGDEG